MSIEEESEKNQRSRREVRCRSDMTWNERSTDFYEDDLAKGAEHLAGDRSKGSRKERGLDII